jgi:hypothetical protein
MPLDDILGADEGGMEAATDSVPQGDTATIARRLLGDDLVNRYGDVIGARKTTAADVLRDFTLGFQNGQAKVDELKLKIQERYQDAYVKQQRSALAKAKIDADKVKGVLDTIKTIQSLPPGHRASILKEQLQAIGIEPSASALKMFTDSDMIAQLPIDKLAEAADNTDVNTSDLAGVMGSGLNAAKFLGEVRRRQKDETQTGNLILEREKKRLSIMDAAAKFNERQAQSGIRQERAEQQVERGKLGIKKDKLSIAKSKAKLAKDAAKPAASLTGDPVLDAALSGGTPATPPPAAPVGIKSITQVK